jgi:hypothetical protein
MRSRIISIVILIAALAIVALGWTQNSRSAEASKWEYLSYQASSSGPSDQEMNKMGAEGWELVAVDVGESRVSRYIFKRKK